MYTETSNIVADGLTKALPQQAFKRFRAQLGMADISHMLEEPTPTLEQEEDVLDELFGEEG